MAYKVVVPNALMRNETIAELLEAEGCEIVRLPAFEPGQPAEWSGEEIERYFLDADAFVGTFGPRPISRKVLEASKKLRVGASPIIGTETSAASATTRSSSWWESSTTSVASIKRSSIFMKPA